MMAQQTNDDDDLFSEVVFPDTYEVFVRCTFKQRECMERMAARLGWSYNKLLWECGVALVKDKPVKDIGELSKREASTVIEMMKKEK